MRRVWKKSEEPNLTIESLDEDDELDISEPELDIQMEKLPEDGKEHAPEEKNNPIREIISWVMTFVLAIALAMILKTYVIINAKVPTGSMENTIQPGDDLLGSRISYTFSEPERGDIIIFYFPDDESQKYVKRIIGLPGDTVLIEEGKVYINDAAEPLTENYLKENWVKDDGPFRFEVPADSYFVMGDNRNSSWDSRYWRNTYVARDKIIGKAVFVYYPFSHFGSLK